MDFNLTKKRLVVILAILILYFIPPIVIGEVLYSYDRNHNYEDLSDFESVKIESQSELQLWYTNSYEKVILIVHGHNDHSSLMYTRYSAIFESLNLDMVFVDLRNHGRSGDHGPITMGIDEANDITEVLLWMNNLWDEIILFGTSMGAISNLLAMNSENIGDIRDKVSHIIFDSMFTSFDSAIDNTLRKYLFLNFGIL